MDSKLISFGCHVVVCRGQSQRIAHITGDGTFHVEKLRLDLRTAVGQPFTTSFKVDRGKMTPTEEIWDEVDDEAVMETSGDEKDNRNLLDTGTSQTLSKDDILGLRSDGICGQQLIEKIVSNSATFQAKNPLTQKKYLKRKTKKHGDIVTLLRPTPHLLCDIHFLKNPEQICNLRIDSLAYILSMANVHSGCRVLLYEQTCGVLAASILDRLRGRGSLVHLFRGGNYQGFPAVEAMDFSPDEMKSLLPIPLESLFDVEVRPTLQGKQKWTAEKVSKPEWSQEKKEEFTAAQLSRNARQAERLAKEQEGQQLLLDSNIDTLIVAVKSISPVSLTVELLKYLSSSRPFVIFSPFIEPLLELFKQLKADEAIVNLMLTDSFLRRYQILPMRSHPEMNQICTNGYLLSGIKLVIT